MKSLLLKCVAFLFLIASQTTVLAGVTPNPGYEGDRFTFTFTLPNTPLPKGYEWRINFELSPGSYSSIWTPMDDGPQTFIHSRTISTPGIDRRYRMAAFLNGTRQSDIVVRTYTVLEREYEFASGYPRASSSSPQIGQSVTFSANTTASVGSVEIDMGGGDGYQRMSSNSSKTQWTFTRGAGFSTSGTKQIRFRIKDDANGVKNSATLSLTVRDQDYEFSSGYPFGSPSSPKLRESVTFRANTTDSVALVEIDMGGGDGYQPMSSNSSKTSWVFTRSSGFSTPGTKTIRFRIRDASGSTRKTQSLSLTVLDQQYEFVNGYPRLSPNSPRVGESVTFFANTTEPVSSVYIDMGGGDGFQLMGSNSAKTEWFKLRSGGFQSIGSRSAVFQIRDGAGSIRSTRSLSFNVQDQEYAFLTNSPSISPESPKVQEPVTFQAVTTESVSLVEIDMGGGDGYQPMQANAGKTVWTRIRPSGFASVGARSVSLRIRDQAGTVRRTATLAFNVQDKEYQFESLHPQMSPSSASVGERVTFYANTTGPVDLVEIDMGGGDGFQAMGSNSDKDNWFKVRSDGFRGAGEKIISFRIKDGNNTVRESRSIQVDIIADSRLFKTGFPQAQPDRVFQGQSVEFIAETTEAVHTVAIDMGGGDGFQGMSANADRTVWTFDRVSGFSSLGDKAVRFRVNDVDGNIIGESQVSVSVVEETLAEFSARLLDKKPNLSVLLDDANLDKSFARGESALLIDAFLLSENEEFDHDLSKYPLPFSDVSLRNDAYEEILKLAYFVGVSDDESVFTRNQSLFLSLDHISRQEFLKAIIQGADLEIIQGNASLTDFLDKDTVIGTVWEKYFNTAVANGLIVGDNGYLRAQDLISVREALLLLRRFSSKTLHTKDGFLQLFDVPVERPLVRELGDENEPIAFDDSVVPIEVTGIFVNEPTSVQRQACDVVNDSEQVKILFAQATLSEQSYPSFRWRSNAGYFKNYSGSNDNQTACFFPASVPPTNGYEIFVIGSDGLGNESQSETRLASDTFLYSPSLEVEEPANQIIDVRFSIQESDLRIGTLFEIDLSSTVVKRQGIELGIENAVVTLDAESAEVQLFAGKPNNGIVSFMVPDVEGLAGDLVSLSIHVNSQHIEGGTQINGLRYLPQFKVSGTVTNAPNVSEPIRALKVGDVETVVDEAGEFSLELALSSPATLLVDVIGNSEENYFPPTFVDLTFTNPTANINLIGRNIVDRDGDGVSDEVDNCPDVSNPEQTDENSNGVGDSCDEINTSPTVTSFFIQGPVSVDESQSIALFALALLSNGETIDLSNRAEWSSSSPSALVNFEGIVTALSVDQTVEATITAVVDINGESLSSSAVVSVLNTAISKVPVSLSFDLPAKIGEEIEVQLQARVEFSDGDIQDVTNQVVWLTDSNSVSVDRFGLLVAEDGESDRLATITARYTYNDETLSVSENLTIENTIQPRTILSVNVIGEDSIVEGDTKKYSAIATYSDQSTADVSDLVVWRFTYQPSMIDRDGHLFVEDTSRYVQGDYFLSATLQSGSAEYSDTKTVSVVDITDSLQLIGLKVITSGSIYTNTLIQFRAEALYEGGSKRIITKEGDWSGEIGGFKISPDGKLNVESDNPASGLIFVSFTHLDNTIAANVSVNATPRNTSENPALPAIFMLLLDETKQM